MFNMTALKTGITPPLLGLLTLGILFLPAAFYFQPNLGGEGMFIPFNSTVWLATSLVISTAVLCMLSAGHIALPHYWPGLAALPVGVIISGFVVESYLPTEWLFRQLYILGGFLFLLALFQFDFKAKQRDQLIILLLLAGLAHALYGISQIIWPGIYPSLIVPSNGTPYGMFQQINLQASLQATTLLLALYLLSRPLLRQPGRILPVLLLTTIFSSSFIVAYAGSRVGLLATVIGLVIVCIGRWPQLKQRNALFIGAIILIATAGVLGKDGLLKATGKFQDMSVLDDSVATLGTGSRKNIYAISLTLLKEAPLFGHGIGSFQKEWHREKVNFLTTHPQAALPPERLSHPHNELLFWMVEGGLVSIAGMLIAAAATLIAALKCGWRRGSSYLALLLPIGLHTQVELPFYISNVHWFLLLALLYLILQHRTYAKTLRISTAASTSLAATAVLFFAVTTAFMLHTLYANAGLIRFLESRMAEPKHLMSGLKNPYFNEISELFMMRTLLLRDLQSEQQTFVPQFINWATPYLEYRPMAQIYLDLSQAHLAIGERDQALSVMHAARAIYPLDQGLTRAMTAISERLDTTASGAVSTASTTAPALQQEAADQ